ncbi:polysaccharide biosynthesis protein GumE [Sphingomonas sp. IC4-52]|uniref:polysaccharide biosynthesis protein GumE n=1 Tax=Sphingomonas sp. IC4-52 TaxID=2887202 RepID=UPI001D120B09|nr:polysaccharide biosynthesis protein GumE [Sphingomonas sp. IC4-52]MCC2979786.1 polysaccharide biosynthesis protein GumE [Sphingomonas sp. IC4-52]
MAEQAEQGSVNIQAACAILLAATVLFNPALALAGAIGLPLSASLVASTQALIVAGALILGMAQPKAPPYGWIAAVLGLLAVSALTGAVRSQFDAKSLGDVLLVPAFIMLGARLTPRTLIVTLVMLQALVLIVGIWEVADPEGFGARFKIAEYYVRTRGFSEADFWAGGDLFISSERPQGRLLLAGSGLHRGSSLFLEPVSLGNWSVVVAIATAVLWSRLSVLLRTGLIVSTLMLLIICDGRLSLSVCLMLLAFLPIARHLPERFSVLYLPGCILALVLAARFGLLIDTGDTFAGRLRYAVDAFGRLNIDHLLGISSKRVGMEDAGLAYFVVRQSIFVAVGLWLLLTLTSLGDDRAGRICKHGFMLFVVLCLPISNALLSIKTAAFMWAVYGFCYGQARRRAAPAGPGAPASTGDQSPTMDPPIIIGARGWASGHG